MADKKNENKIMAMLERTGVIRKADAVDNPDLVGRNGSDIKPIFDAPDNSVKVTQASRQPVPGMSTPIFPSEKPSEKPPEPRVQEAPVRSAPVEDTPRADIPKAEPIREEVADFSVQDAIEMPSFETDPFKEEVIVDEYEPTLPAAPVFTSAPPAPAPAPYVPPVAPEREPTPENYTDRFLGTEELYEALALRSKKTDSIYLIEEYLQTLPDSLPDAQRRDIVNKLISASGFDYDLLMGDGVLRVKMLKEYAERFARHTDDYIAARQNELDELDRQILRTQKLISSRKDLHKKQFFSIEAEAQRLKEILTFISG